ncbi:MAG: DUF1127 domain-containing protein [Sulfitobacter sp.]
MTHSTLVRPTTCVPARRSVSVLSMINAVQAAWRSRQQLAALEDHMLEDIGITQKAARTEANRPLWDVPAHWLQ